MLLHTRSMFASHCSYLHSTMAVSCVVASVFRSSLCYSLFITVSISGYFHNAEAVSVHVSKPDINWDTSRFVPARIGNQNWWHGSATYYDSIGSSGACGFPLSITDNIYHAAVPDPRWSNSLTAGVGGFSGAPCGQCFQLRCVNQPRYNQEVFCNAGAAPITVRVTDCDVPKPGGWPPNHFDLNPIAYNQMADPRSGIINIKWRRVHCATSGPKWALTSDSNGYFHDIIVYDVPGVGAITGLVIQPRGMGWQKVRNRWGAETMVLRLKQSGKGGGRENVDLSGIFAARSLILNPAVLSSNFRYGSSKSFKTCFFWRLSGGD